MRRAYRNPPWTYWSSVLVDPLTVLKLWSTAVRRQHTWRGRPVRRGYNGG
jgi:dolichol-phosphate mannosyltransferase